MVRNFWFKCIILSLAQLCFAVAIIAQDAVPASIKIQYNTIYITINKNINERSLVDFTHRYNVKDIGLYELIKTGRRDSLAENGWKTIGLSRNVYSLSKEFDVNSPFKNPTDKMIFYAIPTPENWRVILQLKFE